MVIVTVRTQRQAAGGGGGGDSLSSAWVEWEGQRRALEETISELNMRLAGKDHDIAQLHVQLEERERDLGIMHGQVRRQERSARARAGDGEGRGGVNMRRCDSGVDIYMSSMHVLYSWKNPIVALYVAVAYFVASVSLNEGAVSWVKQKNDRPTDRTQAM